MTASEPRTWETIVSDYIKAGYSPERAMELASSYEDAIRRAKARAALAKEDDDDDR